MEKPDVNYEELSAQEKNAFIINHWGYEPIETSRKLVEFQRAYYEAIREMVENYSPILEAFPPHMFGKRRIVIIYAVKGILILHCHDKEDTFHARILSETLEETNLSVLFGPKAKPPFDDYFRFSFAFTLSDGRVGGFDWVLVEHAKPPFIEFSGAERGREFGKAEVKAFASAHLMRLKEATPSVICKTLSEVISKFESLLSTATVEEELQKFLSENPILIDPTAFEITPKLKLGSEHITDYVARKSKTRYEFVEIEKSSHNLYTSANNPTAQLTHAIKQTEDWAQWLTDHISYAREKLPELNEQFFRIIIGRSKTLSEADSKALSRLNAKNPSTRVMTYDDLLIEAKQHLQNLRTLEEHPHQQIGVEQPSKPLPAHLEKLALFGGEIAKMAIDQIPAVLEGVGYRLIAPM